MCNYVLLCPERVYAFDKKGKTVKKILIYLMRFGLNLIYAIMKLCPVKAGRVVFLSRQSDVLTPDFEMVQELLEKKEEGCTIVTVCHRLEGESGGGLISFAAATLKSMYHMATSEVCVLDAYWPAVSILHHRKNLKVIQMWHALGKIKQSGYQTLGKESGRSREMARLMKMHVGYDYIIAGGKAWNPYYCMSFNTTEDKLRNFGLPRIDKLLNTAEANRKKVLQAYPELEKKTVILYAPTFRRNIELNWKQLVSAIAGKAAAGQNAPGAETADNRTEEYALIVKGHPNQKLDTEGLDVYTCDEFSSVDLISSADYLITDYSAIAIEGAVLNVKTLYFVYDYEEYRRKNGMNIDLFETMPGCVFRKPEELAEVIRNNTYNQAALDEYRRKYLPEELGTSTEKIVDLIRENLRK